MLPWGWANQFEDVPANLATELQREVFDLLAATEHIYHLSELGDEPIHD